MLNELQFRERCQAVEYTPRLTFDQIALSMGEDLINKTIASALHRLDKSMAVIIAGDPNVGKTALIKHLFTDEVLLERYGEFFSEHEKHFESLDQPDLTQEISKLPLGRVQDPDTQGLIIYDTPGLGSDFPEIANTARVALGMEQVAPRLTHVRVRFYSLPEALHEPAEFDEKEIPIDEVTQLLNDRELTCIFVVNGASDQLSREVLKSNVNWLRKHFENKVVFVKTFRDQLETWTNKPMIEGEKGRRDRRYEDLDAILGEEAVWVNGATGEGIDRLAHALLGLHGYQGYIGQHLSVEMKCQRLLSASQQIPGVIIPAFFSMALADDAATQLSDLLSFLAGFLIHIVYTEDPSKDSGIQAFQEEVKRFTDALKDAEVKSSMVWRYEPPEGFWENVLAILHSPFGGIYGLKLAPGTRLSRTPETLAQFYYWVYTLIHDRENREDVSVIEGALVPEAEGLKWFVDQFQPHQRFFSEDEDPWKFYQAIGAEALTKFWETHHPEVLPVYKQTDTREVGESTG